MIYSMLKHYKSGIIDQQSTIWIFHYCKKFCQILMSSSFDDVFAVRCLFNTFLIYQNKLSDLWFLFLQCFSAIRPSRKTKKSMSHIFLSFLDTQLHKTNAKFAVISFDTARESSHAKFKFWRRHVLETLHWNTLHKKKKMAAFYC